MKLTNSELAKKDNTKQRVELRRMQEIAVQLIDVIKILSKRQGIKTMALLKRYTNITSDELDELDIRIVSGAITKK